MQPNPNQPVSTPNDLLPFAVLPYVTFSGQYGEFFLNICRGPPEDIINFLTLMSSKMTLFYVIFENWAFYINVRISEAEVVVIWNL